MYLFRQFYMRFPVLIEFFFSVFRFWMIFSTVLQFLMDPNAPPPLQIVSSVSYENILIDSTLMKHFVGLKSSQFEVLHSLLDDVSPFAANRFPSSMLGSRV